MHVVWDDDRNDLHLGRRGTYYTLALGHQTYAQGLAGSGGLAPRLTSVGPHAIGQTVTLDVTNALGGATGGVALSLAGRASLTVLGGTLLVQPPLMQLPLVLAGTTGVPGDGTGSVSIALPSLLALIGQRLDSQAFVVDPGALQGIAMSAGLETWVL